MGVGDRRRADLGHEPHSRLLLVLEAEVGDPDDVAVLCAGARQEPRHAEPLQLVVDVRQRLGGRDVVEGDHPLDLTADQTELVLADALDASALGLGAEDDDAFGLSAAR